MSYSEQQLSTIVRKYEVLYDRNNPEFRMRERRNEAWAKVAEEVGLENGAEAEKVFIRLRDRYARTRKLTISDEAGGIVSRAEGKLANLQHLYWLDKFIKPRIRAKKADLLHHSDEYDIGVSNTMVPTGKRKAVTYIEIAPSGHTHVKSVPEIRLGDVFEESGHRHIKMNPTSPSTEMTGPSYASYVERAVDHDNGVLPEDASNTNRLGSKTTVTETMSSTHDHQKNNVNSFDNIEYVSRPEKRKASTHQIEKYFDNREQGNDEFDVFGKYVASKMRKLSQVLSEHALASVEYDITTVLMKARKYPEQFE